PTTRNPKPEARNQKPEPRTPNPETRNPRPETRTPNPEPRTPNPEPRTPLQNMLDATSRLIELIQMGTVLQSGYHICRPRKHSEEHQPQVDDAGAV
ncbi:hypothetical protein T484DRAFT_1637257, partial [Baffinella frigidus]